MRFLRRTWRIVKIFFYMLYYSLLVFRKTFYRKRMSKRDYSRTITDYTQKWAQGLLKILDVELEVEGDFSDLRENGGLMISNHQTYIDILVHAAVVGIRFTPNLGIRSWFFFGWFVNLSNPIWVNRKNPRAAQKTLMEFRETIRNGTALMIYPEGTTTRGDLPLLPFKSTAFETVCGTEIPIHPILTFFRGEEGDAPVQWYDHSGFGEHVMKFLANKKTYAKVVRLPDYYHSAEKTRKEMAQETYDILNNTYQPLKREFGGCYPPDMPEK